MAEFHGTPLVMLRLLFVFLAALAGCSVFRANPLDLNRGAIVLVFDTHTCGDLKRLRQLLSQYDARAMVFAGGQIHRGLVLPLFDLRDCGCEIGLSGLRGVSPQSYSLMYGQQKYFQDEIVTQVLDAKRHGLHPRYFLMDTLSQAKSETLNLPSFLVTKGFMCIVHRMPASMPPRAKTASELTSPFLHAYQMTTNSFDRAQIAALAKHNEILIISPDQQVLPSILSEAQAQGVPFATVSDLRIERQ